ncbi:dsRBD fold-containing protein [Georgenia alba]|uniref:DsRBD fold-containing protein n=1 Tax=Georgenia alba TaxID=2233858 RepID=A0ABW2Q266_9MICO
MKATTGDRIVTASGVVGGAVREGVIVEVMGVDGAPPYRVRWSDTAEETICHPGPDSVVRPEEPGEAAGAPRPPSQVRSQTWHVQLTLVESGGSTVAEATLVGGSPDQLRAVGHARKDPGDDAVPLIGDEVAAGRALHRLAERLMEAAEHDITAQTGHPAHVHR